MRAPGSVDGNGSGRNSRVEVVPDHNEAADSKSDNISDSQKACMTGLVAVDSAGQDLSSSERVKVPFVHVPQQSSRDDKNSVLFVSEYYPARCLCSTCKP